MQRNLQLNYLYMAKEKKMICENQILLFYF